MTIERLKEEFDKYVQGLIKSLEAPLFAGASKSTGERLEELADSYRLAEDFADCVAQRLRDLRDALDEAAKGKARLIAAIQRTTPLFQ